MFRREPTLLEQAINAAILDLNRHDPASEEHAKRMELLTKLHAMKVAETSKPVSKDVVANIAANLLGILMIIKHESVNVITSKALSFVTRLR